MRARVNRGMGGALALAVVVVDVHAERALADPVIVTGFLDGQLHGARLQEQIVTLLPGFQHRSSRRDSSDAGFLRRMRNRRARWKLSFIGPPDVLEISNDPFATDFLSESVQWSGSLTITQPNRVLFSGTVGGSGVGSASYLHTGALGTGTPRLDGDLFEFNGIAQTPEPASIVLVGTGVAWLAVKRRKSSPRP